MVSASSLTRTLHFSRERPDVALLERLIEQAAIEVAVVADGTAERDVEVEA